MFNDFYEIRRHFNKLDSNLDHFVNSNDICTPLDCVKEMVDSIPEDFWQRNDLKILDCCCGNGNFHAYISLKTKLENLFFNEINEKRIRNLVDYFGNNINLRTQDFLTFDDNPIYDLIVANPPYAKFNNNERVSKNHNMSRDFIKKAINLVKDGGYILFIVPNNWMSFSDRNLLPKILSQYQFKILNIGGAKKYFPKVGSSFTWFLLQKSPNKDKVLIQNSYIIKDTQYAFIDKDINFIPLYYSEKVRDIFNKTVNNSLLEKYKIETSSDLHRYTQKKYISNLPTPTHNCKIIHTPSQVVYSSKPHKFQDGYKVFISLTNQYGTFIDNCGMTQSIAFIKANSYEDAVEKKKELDNPIYIFLNNLTRYGNFNNIRVMQNFPLLPSINLTSEEDKFIEYVNAIYYNKVTNIYSILKEVK